MVRKAIAVPRPLFRARLDGASWPTHIENYNIEPTRLTRVEIAK